MSILSKPDFRLDMGCLLLISDTNLPDWQADMQLDAAIYK
jgi:hypothetical protein